MVQELPLDLKRRPDGAALRSFLNGATSEEIKIPAGRTTLGASPAQIEFGWDNEFQEQTVEVRSFKMDSLPVTNGEFLDFLASGAYEDPRYWSKEDWAWKSREGLRHPNFWRQVDGAWFYRAMFDLLPLDSVSSWPVYASLAEARAYACWKHKRLPSEAEYNRAAFGRSDGGEDSLPWGEDEPAAGSGNFDFRNWSPVPVGSDPKGASAWGIHELIGNGWEWTETEFAPFPGFVPLESYPQYSADFFDGKHFVLKGASWATPKGLLRKSFRNWYQAHYPYVFAKFRCVSEV
jgi:formylglycine-generating enzyme required for sulfatase activity